MRTDLRRLQRDASTGTAIPAHSQAKPAVAPAKSRSVWIAAVTIFVALALISGYWFGTVKLKRAAASGAPSIAVLPFVDMSPQKDQEYFSDGLAEELLNDLARIKGRQVAGRTSSFAFKGKNEDLRVIAKKLNVSTILEGSVRKEGKRVRITAQLVAI